MVYVKIMVRLPATLNLAFLSIEVVNKTWTLSGKPSGAAKALDFTVIVFRGLASDLVLVCRYVYCKYSVPSVSCRSVSSPKASLPVLFASSQIKINLEL